MRTYSNTSWVSKKLELRQSRIHGYGIFTTTYIKKGEIVIIWGGKVYTGEEIRQGKAKQHSMVGIDEDLYLATPESDELSIDDFMNHCCNPNIWMQDEVTLVAKRNILADEELTADYAIWLNTNSYQMKNICNCGYEFCRKIITGEDWMIKQVQTDNMYHFSPFLNRRINKMKTSK